MKIGQYDRPVVEFSDGSKLTLNATNVKTMIQAYGPDSRGWVDVEVELYAGQTMYNGAPQESVLVRPTPMRKPKATEVIEPPRRTPPRDGMNDAIPF